ncbi:triose-phosphate isomerase [Ancylobacter radicis]|uniref:Triosephosphate isomerase n=1 Tax=Ancylobacter radicis TaxID=2836179 RepID=A0ABS5R4A7_9HYPH|nr:triose-phosphate isomerase [Ancylobacter radicis]MBS9476317.1 triose-phosphate isomerase [Ancylobacter radicis]
MSMRRPLVAGNWKMNGLKATVAEFARIAEGYDAGLRAKADLMICPPATLLSTLAVVALGSHVGIGAQDCHAKASGAHTGDISAEMIADTGASAVIVGHSERRADHHESDAMVHAKAEAAWRAGLLAVICVGETRTEREAGAALDVVRGQLAGSLPAGATAANTVIAYEPVWAIGTGLTPTLADIAQMHGDMRAVLLARFGAEGAGMRLLYGGSVKPDNAREILGVADVDGALVGGASLTADTFLPIARAYL